MDIVLPGKGSAGSSSSQAGGGRAGLALKGMEQELQALQNPSKQQAAFAVTLLTLLLHAVLR